MPEPLSPEGYAAAGGTLCPVCSSTETEVEMDFSESDLRTVIQQADCLACGATWAAIYELTGYDNLTLGEKETTP